MTGPCPMTVGAVASRRGGFSLTELLMVISILTILGGLTLSLIRGARYDANAARTETQIRRITQFLNARLEDFDVRVLPLRLRDVYNAGLPLTPAEIQNLRNRLLLEYVRGELPCVATQVSDPLSAPAWDAFPSANFANDFNSAPNLYTYPGPAGPPLVDYVRANPPALVRRYARRLNQYATKWDASWPPIPPAQWNTGVHRFEGAECLYEILNAHTDFESSGLDFLFDEEIGDVDNDGRKEVLDAWGDPLNFVVTLQPLPPGTPAAPPDQTTKSPLNNWDNNPRNIPNSLEAFPAYSGILPQDVRFYVRSINALDR